MTATVTPPSVRTLPTPEVDTTTLVKTKRRHSERFPVVACFIDPKENYRWTTEAAMQADISKKDVIRDDGSAVASYEILKLSIRAAGVEEPIGVVKRADDKYHVIYGFTRALAATELGLKYIPAYIYESTLPESEAKLLQARENSPTLKRTVHWYQELTMHRKMRASLTGRSSEDLDKLSDEMVISRLPALTGFMSITEADQHICQVLGRNPTTIRTRMTVLRNSDPRIQDLARSGRLTVTALMAFASWEKTYPYDRDFIDRVLANIKRSGDFPAQIEGAHVQQSMKLARFQGAGMSGISKSGSTKSYVPDKRRQSPAILRDVAASCANVVLLQRRLTVDSGAEAIDSLSGSGAWERIIGIGMGAGEIPMPPAMELDAEKVIAVIKRSQGDDVEDIDATEEGIESMQNIHERTAERYATSMFVHAFLRNEVQRRTRNFLLWLPRSHVAKRDGRSQTYSNHASFYGLIQETASRLELQSLSAKVKAATVTLRAMIDNPAAATTATVAKRA